MSGPDQRNTPSGAVTLAAALGVALLNLVAAFPFAAMCIAGENLSDLGKSLCDGTFETGWLAGVIVVLLVLCVAWLRDSRFLYNASLLLAVVIAAVPWLLFGDPAGNFGGLFSGS